MRTDIGAFKINKNTERADQAQFNSTYYAPAPHLMIINQRVYSLIVLYVYIQIVTIVTS